MIIPMLVVLAFIVGFIVLIRFMSKNKTVKVRKEEQVFKKKDEDKRDQRNPVKRDERRKEIINPDEIEKTDSDII